MWVLSTVIPHPVTGGMGSTAMFAENGCENYLVHPSDVIAGVAPIRCLVWIRTPAAYIPDPDTNLLPNITLNTQLTGLEMAAVRQLAVANFANSYVIRRSGRPNMEYNGLVNGDFPEPRSYRDNLITMLRYLGFNE